MNVTFAPSCLSHGYVRITSRIVTCRFAVPSPKPFGPPHAMSGRATTGVFGSPSFGPTAPGGRGAVVPVVGGVMPAGVPVPVGRGGVVAGGTPPGFCGGGTLAVPAIAGAVTIELLPAVPKPTELLPA